MVIVYDNINFKDIKRDELLSYIFVIHSLTTTVIIYCPKLPPLGLYQLIYNPTILLNIKDIYHSPSFGDELLLQISHYLIANIIKGIYLTSIEHIFKDSDLFPQMLSIQYISNRKTKFQQFSAIIEDKSTIQGTYSVYKSIFLNQLGLQALDNPYNSITPNNFTKRLQLTYGNQLTTHYIRLVKQEQIYTSRPFNYQDWLLGIPIQFYIKINLCSTLVRIHFTPKDKQKKAYHCLQSNITLQNHSIII